MAEHSVSYNGIIYIIPTDDLYRKYENSEAFIDKYGRLIDSKSKKVIKELEHKGDLRPVVQRKVVIVQPPEEHPVRDAAKQAVDDVLHEHICRAVYWTFDVGIPSLWHEYIVPFFHQTKETLTSRELKVDAVLAETRASTDVAIRQPKATTKMSKEEADAEKRKVLYYWLGMLISLKKLHDAGEIDMGATMAQLTDPAMLERVNGFLSENPNLLETDKYIVLHSLLGRDLYEEQQLIPIRATEITTIAAKFGYDPRTDKMEDNHHG